jgi:hypothetical protein
MGPLLVSELRGSSTCRTGDPRRRMSSWRMCASLAVHPLRGCWARWPLAGWHMGFEAVDTVGQSRPVGQSRREAESIGTGCSGGGIDPCYTMGSWAEVGARIDLVAQFASCRMILLRC